MIVPILNLVWNDEIEIFLAQNLNPLFEMSARNFS